MSANIKRSTGKSKRRWKKLQKNFKWIPYVAIREACLAGDWDKDVARMFARDYRFDNRPKSNFNLEEFNKTIQDMNFCGTGIMKDGKHIPISEWAND